MSSKYLFLLLSLLFLADQLSTPLAAQSKHQTVDPVLFDGLEYRSVGPSRGGRSTAIAGIPSQPFTFFMGATGGGVWKTQDAGMNWENLSDGQIEAGSIGAITVAPSDPATIYVGTGSACARGNVSAGIGLYKSQNGGKKWSFIGLPKAGQIGKIVVHPQNPELVYVAALGQIFGKNPERGVYRSKDGGENWEQVLFVSDSTGAIDIVMNPDNPRELFAAMWRAERKPWTLIDGGPEGGIWRSSDGGTNWEKLEGGLPTGLLGKIGLAISPANPKRIWAIIQAAEEEKGGLYRSDDGGDSWSRICRDHQLRQRGWYYSHITAHPTDENTLYSNNVSFYKSIDGGKSFDQRISVPHGDTHGLWINPNNPNIMINCNDGGACISLNGGETWSTQLNQPTSEFYRVTVDDQFPYRLYAGQQDNSTISVPSHDPGGVTPFQNWFSVGGSESADVGVHPENPDILWAGSYSGELTIMNRKTGHVRQVTAYPHYTEGTEQRDLKYRWQWNFPIVLSRHEPGTVYHTSNYVHKSTDDGQSWEKISPDLTRDLDQYQDIPGGPIQHDATGVEVYSSIFAFEESPHQAGEFWAGSDDGLLHISRDNGESWQNITPKGMPYEGTINKIELSAHQAGRALVAVYNYRYNDFKPYIYLTDDHGKSWSLLTNGNGIPENHFVRAVAEDPAQKGLLYAGTEYGMYVSFDNGKNWQPFQLNLPVTPITDMEVVENDLVLSTQGRAFWVLDDLTPLHQLSGKQSTSRNVFFQPRPAIRTSVDDYDARLHFYLAKSPDKKDPVTVTVKDSNGKVIRTLSTKADNRLNKIKAKKGFNTVQWDLRHEGPELVSNLVAMVIRNPSPGPYAVPGNYQVEIQAGNWSETQNLQIQPDPRWTHVQQADYEAQLETVIAIRDMITDAHKRIKNLRALRDQMKSISDLAVRAGHSEKLKEMSNSISEKLIAIEDQIIQNKAETSQDNINYPRVFTNHIGRLYGVAMNAHHRPTGGVLERWEDVKAEYQGIIDQYKTVVDQEITNYNELLEKEKISGLIVPEKVK